MPDGSIMKNKDMPKKPQRKILKETQKPSGSDVVQPGKPADLKIEPKKGPKPIQSQSVMTNYIANLYLDGADDIDTKEVKIYRKIRDIFTKQQFNKIRKSKDKKYKLINDAINIGLQELKQRVEEGTTWVKLTGLYDDAAAASIMGIKEYDIGAYNNDDILYVLSLIDFNGKKVEPTEDRYGPVILKTFFKEAPKN